MIESVSPPRKPSGGNGMPGFEAVPDAQGRMVGPFALLATIGPMDVPPGITSDADARPHPHIGMGVLAYITSGEITHRDDLGNSHHHRAGEATWMLCGSGVVHSERLERLRAEGGSVQGLVAFLALPEHAEECAPDWQHIGSDSIPVIESFGARGRLLLGSAQGARSRVALHSAAYLIHWELGPDALLFPQMDHPERALHVVSGEVEHLGQMFGPGEMVTLIPGASGSFRAETHAVVIEFGGESVGARYRWWNFVASRLDLIDAAKQRWLDDNRSLPPGETEFTPLPSDEERPLMLLLPGASAALAPTEQVA